MSQSAHVTYTYTNKEKGITQLWLALPKSNSLHQQVHIKHQSHQPKKITSLFNQDIAYFELEEMETLELL
ncbi:hypothetical protein H1Z61_12300 [Bacillus aquiflavi]|uniref:Uncharacterized protein n=1 Tax=Bacillus aquiflavi TaxID=2672567 RepID=A0A6B3W0M6_9BACI|nr:hypothetical protein [Bacillus aquiflavi]MBA4537889.1 hypothetical protein [Bacillus aquiflavi]NEY82145.1 hypothetical protein [Bacillus aquiflavi]UAC48413.1 hypothetical protein K6959_18295 [Bacillus aquiflavi]